jgi:hypothetical protein
VTQLIQSASLYPVAKWAPGQHWYNAHRLTETVSEYPENITANALMYVIYSKFPIWSIKMICYKNIYRISVIFNGEISL